MAETKSVWKESALRFAEALVDSMDGIPDYDIQAETGLPKADCERIAKARRDAKLLLEKENG